MNHRTRNVLIAAGTILLIGCICVAVVGIGGLGYLVTGSRVNQPTVELGSLATELPVATAIATKLPESSPESSPTPLITSEEQSEATPTLSITSGSAELPIEIQTEMDEIEDQIVELRGLQPNRSVSRDLLSQGQLRQRVMDDFLEDYTDEEAQDDARVLAAFGLLDADFDLINLYLDLYSEQIAGFYDDETEEMYVIQGEGFEGPERLTYAHEYTHALQDQNYNFENVLLYTDAACEEDSERCAAIQALIEGDASLAEFEWLTNFATTKDILDIQQFYGSYVSPVYDSAPAFLKEDFLFPYNYGQSFVQYLHDRGGWSSVNAAYVDLPVSTEQILHPEQYPEDKPVPVDLPDLSGILGDGWREIDRGVMGEWYTYLILALGEDPGARLAEEEASEASAGWGGDAYAVYFNDETGDTAMTLAYRWESESDADQFVNSFSEYATQKFGGPDQDQPDLLAWEDQGGYTALHVDGLNTTWVFAPDSGSALNIWQGISTP